MDASSDATGAVRAATGACSTEPDRLDLAGSPCHALQPRAPPARQVQRQNCGRQTGRRSRRNDGQERLDARRQRPRRNRLDAQPEGLGYSVQSRLLRVFGHHAE